jgi:hypothetical protein
MSKFVKGIIIEKNKATEYKDLVLWRVAVNELHGITDRNGFFTDAKGEPANYGTWKNAAPRQNDEMITGIIAVEEVEQCI